MNIWIVLVVFSVFMFLFLLFKKIRPVWKKLIGIALSIILIIFSVDKFIFPPHGKILPTGPYKVIEKDVFLKHTTAFKEYETEEGKREIPVKFWLPKTDEKKTHTLIIFSHGSFGVSMSNETLFNELASRGYIVGSISSPKRSFTSKLSNGKSVNVDFKFLQSVMKQGKGKTKEGLLQDLKDWLSIPLEDLNFVVDEIVAGNVDKDIDSMIDKKNIFLMGHSLGGSASLEVGRIKSSLFKGIIVLEAPFIGSITGVENDKYTFINEEYPIPILHFYSDATFPSIKDFPGTEYGMNKSLMDLYSSKFKNIHVENTGHLGLTDLRINSPFLTSLVDKNLNKDDYKNTLKIINDGVLDFLNEFEN